MNWRFPLVVCGFLLAASPAGAQLTLPGAAAAAPPASPAPASRPNRPGAKAANKAKAKPIAEPGTAAIDGHLLMLNGRDGLLQLSGSGRTLIVAKLRLPGETVSNPSQRCIVDIVGESPIEATSEGRPDGLDRFDVDVPACPFAFDVLDGAVLVPSQITACVFKAADCQTSPGGVWGPGETELEKEATAIGKRRGAAETAISKALRRIERQGKDNPDAEALLRDQNAFPGEREAACKDYVKETDYGFCAASLTEARAALLEARAASLSSSTGRGGDKAEKKGKKKPQAETTQQ
jgi:hypothetical protein